MKQKRFLTQTEHEQLGALLARMRGEMDAVFAMTGTVYKPSSKVDRKARNAKNALDELRSMLDDQVLKDLPEQDYETLNHLYYGVTPHTRAHLIPTLDAIREWPQGVAHE